jgi:hypothetical protein
MATGFQSNYNDSGYTLTGTWYDQTGNQVTTPTSSGDIYISTQQTGVFMISGTYNSANIFYPVNSSGANVENLGMPNSQDDAWLVYPGYGFTLYTSTNYSGTTSRNYINTSNVPVVFYNGGSSGQGWVGYGTPILNSSSSSYLIDTTNSVKIYFRGAEVRISAIN